MYSRLPSRRRCQSRSDFSADSTRHLWRRTTRFDLENSVGSTLSDRPPSTPLPPPISYIEHSGGIFRDCSIHDFDIVRWISGREVTTVFATGSNQGDRGIADAGDVDTAATVLTFEGGTIAVVSNTRYNGRGYDCRLEVLGSADSVVAGLDDRLPLRSLDPETSFPSKEPYTFFMDRFTSAYRAELEAFLGVVAGRRESPCTPADAVESAWISEAATHSLREGRPVTITEVKDLFLHDKNEAHT